MSTPDAANGIMRAWKTTTAWLELPLLPLRRVS